MDPSQPDLSWKGGLAFDPSIGVFRAANLGESPMGETPGVVPSGDFPVLDSNLLFQCLDACGPPYQTRAPFEPGLPMEHDSPHKNPPWFSTKAVRSRYPAEQRNH